MSISCTSSSRQLAFALAALVLASPCFAADLPAELQYNGQPVEALCFEKVSADEWTDLATCVPPEIVKLPADAADTWAADKIGSRYRYKEDKSDAVSYSYYSYIGQWSGAPVVLTYSSGGGTGQFTSLISLERNQNKIRVLQGFAAGDRCNGGVVDAQLSFGTLHYGQNITPVDFLQLAEVDAGNIQPYEDLEASANSCFGVARFSDDKFVGVTLVPDAGQNQKDWTEKFKLQTCFNEMYRGLIAQGKKELSVDELKQFALEFVQACMTTDGK